MSDSQRYLCFSLGTEEYAIELLRVREVIAIPDTTPVPFSPPYFLGIMNLRGLIVSVVDLRGKLKIKPLDSSETAVIICEVLGSPLGIVVDSVNSVISPEADEISAKPEVEVGSAANFIQGVYRKEKHLVLIINIENTLSPADRKAMQQGKSSEQKAA